MERVKVSFDFNVVYSNIQTLTYAAELVARGVEVWITASEKNNEYVYEAANSLKIPHEHIIFTEGKEKAAFLHADFKWHLDNDIREVYQARWQNKIAVHYKGNWKEICENYLHPHTILNLFPIPVYATDVPLELSAVIPFLDKQEMSTESDMANYGIRSLNSYILELPECVALRSFVLDKVNYYGQEILNYDYESYRFGQSWISIKEPGQHHTLHTHPNSLISGVIFYGANQENTSSLTFHKMTGGFNVSYIMARYRQGPRSMYATDSIHIPYKPGLLLLFPSYFHHSVPLNQTNRSRKSIAFNSVPVDHLGDEKSLTELKYQL